MRFYILPTEQGETTCINFDHVAYIRLGAKTIELHFIGVEGAWYTSAIGAQLSWTLPFGVLVMFAVMSRFDRAWEEAAYDLGATRWQTIRLVVIPILAPGLVAVALFGFTLSYDEFARTLQTAGSLNTLPLEIWTMTLNITSPSLYALGTVTTIISFVIIAICLGAIASIQKRRAVRVPAI